MIGVTSAWGAFDRSKPALMVPARELVAREALRIFDRHGVFVGRSVKVIAGDGWCHVHSAARGRTGEPVVLHGDRGWYRGSFKTLYDTLSHELGFGLVC